MIRTDRKIELHLVRYNHDDVGRQVETDDGRESKHRFASSTGSSLSQQPEDATPRLSEKIDFALRDLFLSDVRVEMLDQFKAMVPGRPPAEWYTRFTSDTPTDRVRAFWQHQNGEVGMVFFEEWTGLSRGLAEGKSLYHLARLHLALTWQFGDMPYEKMQDVVRKRNLRLAPDKMQRFYVAPCLRDSYASTKSVSGSEHYAQSRLVEGVVREVREMYQVMGECLDNPDVRRQLALVPKKFYEDLLPKKEVSRTFPEFDELQPTPPGTSLWQGFLARAAPENPSSQFLRSAVQSIEEWYEDFLII